MGECVDIGHSGAAAEQPGTGGMLCFVCPWVNYVFMVPCAEGANRRECVDTILLKQCSTGVQGAQEREVPMIVAASKRVFPLRYPACRVSASLGNVAREVGFIPA